MTGGNKNITENLAFAEHILNYYDWEPNEISEITSEINKVKEKVNDTSLYLTVVGEFSSGKSTFINALLRDDLLESNVVQGTTISNTIIRYAPEYNLIVKSEDEEIINLSKKINSKGIFSFIKKLFGFANSSVDSKKKLLKDYIRDVTTTEKYSGRSKEVIIECPAKFLKNGTVIIDTPGTNSIEQWHEEVTKKAIREISDASLILLNGSKPLEKTFLNFIKENLTDVLPHSLFVMTKMDMLRERERERQIQYVGYSIQQNFNIDEAIILPYTPLFVLGEAVPEIKAEYNYDNPDYESLVNNSYLSEEKIISYIKEHKLQMQHEKIMSILRQILLELSDKMDVMKKEYMEKHKILMTHKKRNLTDFTDEMKNKYLKVYEEKSADISVRIINRVRAIHEEQLNQITQEFSECSSREAVEDFCKNTLPRSLETKIRELVDYTLEASKDLEHAEQDILSEFWKDFERTYNELKALEVKKLNRLFKNDKQLALSNSSEFASAGEELHKINDNAKLFQGGGAAIGAVIGSFILPGIGTGVGAALGRFLGDLFAPSLESVKEKAWNQVAPSIDKSYENAISYITEKVDKYDNDIQNNIKKQIDNCIKEYGELINALIMQDEATKKELDIKINELQKDIEKIKNKLGAIPHFV